MQNLFIFSMCCSLIWQMKSSHFHRPSPQSGEGIIQGVFKVGHKNLGGHLTILPTTWSSLRLSILSKKLVMMWLELPICIIRVTGSVKTGIMVWITPPCKWIRLDDILSVGKSTTGGMEIIKMNSSLETSCKSEQFQLELEWKYLKK